MGAYVPLFRFTVEHRFFTDGLCRNLRFIPAEQTTKICRNADLLIREENNGFSVFCEEQKLIDLRREAADAAQRLRLSWLAYSNDPYFIQYTQTPAPNPDQLLAFDNLAGTPDSDGRVRLHAENFVSASDLQSIKAPELNEILDRSALLVRPAFIVSLSMKDGAQSPVQECYVRFAAKTSYWKYYIDDSLSAKELAIVDMDGKADFSQTGKEELRGRQSLVFLSSFAIPMQEKHVQRFQLRERGTWGEKVVVKRLPNASVNRISMETIGGEAALVSEMYIG